MAALVRLGIQVPNFSFTDQTVGGSDSGTSEQGDLFEDLVTVAKTAERVGFDSFFVMDHYRQIPMVDTATKPMPEAYTLLGGVAARTSTIRIGTLVSGVTYRNPAILAKIVTTLDVISSGRAILGIGAAWHDVEHTSYGVDFPSVAERLDMLEEAVQICRLMFEEDAPTFEGRYFSIHDAFNFPRPIQTGGPPILVGGGGERRTLKIAATYADACNLFGDVSVVRRKIDVLTRHCERIGRDPSEICKTRLSALVIAENNSKASDKLEKLARARNYDDTQLSTVVWGDPQTVAEKSRQYIDAGLDGLIFNFPDPVSTDDIELAGEALRHFVAESR